MRTAAVSHCTPRLPHPLATHRRELSGWVAPICAEPVASPRMHLPSRTSTFVVGKTSENGRETRPPPRPRATERLPELRRRSPSSDLVDQVTIRLCGQKLAEA